jgi:hypothetical protein
MSRLRSRVGRYCLIDCIVSQWSWRHSMCTQRILPLSWALQPGYHLRLTVTALVEVISLQPRPITCISLAYAGGWMQDVVCHVEWRMVIKLQSTRKWLL